MNPPIQYIPNFVEFPDASRLMLKAELKWERRDQTPRSEYYINKLGDIPYTYGRGAGRRQYLPQPSHPFIDILFDVFKKKYGIIFDVCFLNMYLNQRDHLGWHADDSPEMDDVRPIATVSLGAEREIWFCPKDNKADVYKQKLENGSLCLMLFGMQDTHLHRIPKADYACGERISLTFRGYVK